MSFGRLYFVRKGFNWMKIYAKIRMEVYKAEQYKGQEGK